MKKKKSRTKNESLRNNSADWKEESCLILINYACALTRKERMSPTSKARREASRNKFVKKDSVPDRVESFGEIDRGKNRSRARPGFVKHI